jgi:hypothetical protein
VNDGDAFFHAEVEGLGGDLDVSEEDELGGFDEAAFTEGFFFLGDDEAFAGFADAGTLFLDVEGGGAVAGGVEAAWVGAVWVFRGGGFRVVEYVRFVWEADAAEGASPAFWGVFQGWRHDGGGAGLAEGGDGFEGCAFEVFVEIHTDAGAAAGEVEVTVIAGVAVAAEEQSLGHDLGAFGRVGAVGDVGDAAAFGFHGDGLATFGIAGDEVELAHEAEVIGGEGNGAGDLRRWIAFGIFGGCFFCGFGEDLVDAVNAAVDRLSFESEVIVLPATFDIHEVE